MVTIRTIEEFDRQIRKLAKKYRSIPSDLQVFVSDLRNNPLQGVDLGNGIRKVRMAISAKGKGKSGGARVITYNVMQDNDDFVISLLTIYDKSEMENISDSFIQSLLQYLIR